MNRESVSLLNRHEASSNEGSGSNSENEMDRAVDTEFFNEFKPDNIDRFNDILKNNIRYIFVKFIIASNVLYVFHKYNTDVLTEADILDVKYSMEGKGRIVAAELLLDRLVVYKGWFHCLIQVLRDPDVKLTHVANEMEKIKDVLCIKFPESRQLTKDTHAAEIPINDATVSSTLQADYLDDVAELDILQENVVSLSDVFTSDFFTTTLTLVVRNRLVIDGNHFTYNGKRIFLSGGNLPWISYGYDFGDGQFQNIKSQMEEQLKKLFEAGGNSMRLWIHVQGETSPAFDSKGMVTGLDTKGTFIDDFKELLSLALQYNILLFPTLWNAAVDQDPHHRLDGLLKDPNKLKSYINNALTPLVKAVSGHPALGGWDIMNEPEGMLNPEVKNEDPCFNTTSLRNSGVGWVVKKYDYKQILRFLNWQAAAIKDVDTKNIVSVGVWNPKSNTDQFGMFDFYSDSCLVKGGGKPLGVMDFLQYHSYSWNGLFDNVSPFKNGKYGTIVLELRQTDGAFCHFIGWKTYKNESKAHSYADYQVRKPIVIGGFWEKDGGGMTITQMFDYVYQHGYSGAWSWDLMSNGDSQRAAIAHIKDYTHNGQISIVL